MLYILGLVGAFIFFVWLGRQKKSGKLKDGSFLNEFRLVRAIISAILMSLAISFFTRGQVLLGGIFAALSAVLAYSSRRPREDNVTPQSDIDAAFSLLGLKRGASAGEIDQAYREKMRKSHPDAGGSEEQAKKLNRARDLLLKHKGPKA